jgi:hypothetical protein
VLDKLRSDQTQAADPLRHHCRNLRCREKLAAPAENLRDAFCCSSCHDNFYRTHCRVCEQPFKRSTGNKTLCGRSQCRAEFRAAPASFWGGRYPRVVSVKLTPKTSTISTPKTALLDDRPWTIIAGPAVSGINRIVGLDPKLAKEQARLGAEVDEHLKALAARIESAPVAKGVIADSAAAERLIATIDGDMSIPDFLKHQNSPAATAVEATTIAEALDYDRVVAAIDEEFSEKE